MAATFLPGIRSASHGMRAIPSRVAANTKPPTMAMCRPEIERMCARPEARMSAVCCAGTQAS